MKESGNHEYHRFCGRQTLRSPDYRHKQRGSDSEEWQGFGRNHPSLKDDNPLEDISYLKATEKVATYPISDFQDKDTISIKVLSGASIRLDYISVTWAEPRSCVFTAANLAAGGKFRLPSMSTASPTRIIMPMEQPIWSSSYPPHRNC